MGSPGKPTDKFVHLHLHSQYSLLDGAIQFPDLIDKCKSSGMDTVAVTDHGNMFGAIEFYDYATKHDIKPILGVETYVAPASRFEKKGKPDESNSHLTLLAKNNTGYRNLCRLLSHAFLEGFYYKPRIDKEILEQHSEGLVALSGCLSGELAKKLRTGDDDGAEDTVSWFTDVFGKENYFIEVMENGLLEQNQVNEKLLPLARRHGLKVVATGDCHYLNQSDAPSHDVLLCIGTGKQLADPNRMKFSNDQYFVKSPEQMAHDFRHLPEAVTNTVGIGEMTDISFNFGDYKFPKFVPPDGMTLDEFMAQQARAGLAERLGQIRAYWSALEIERGTKGLWEEHEEEYARRLEHEIDIIQSMGFSGYFLIVADFINWAKNHGVPVGPGRGSAAGSLVAFSMRITDIDPIPQNLLFERFLNPERVSMPDIDVDFCMIGRDQVIEYVQERYGGAEFVGQIITFGKMQAKAVLRDVGRVMGMPYGEVDRIAKLVPNTLNIKLDQALEQSPPLKELYGRDGQIKQLIDTGRALEGMARHAGVHAAGVVIADAPLNEYLPLYRGTQGETVTQYDMKWVEKVGLIKFDFLGLKTLTMIHDCIRRIKEGHGVDIDLEKLPLNDEKVFELLTSADTDGVFQVESSGMKDLLVRLKPSTFGDIVALVALYRPGPLQSGMVQDFIDRKHGRAQIEYPLPQLEPILKDTYGVILYQEQVMQIASALAGYTLGDADLLRRAMGKKKVEEMEAQRERFLKGAKERDIASDKATYIFDLMEKFAGYGFNKSHSAAYGLITYQTAYLKAHYPVEFMAALLTIDAGNSDKVLHYVHSCNQRGIEVLPPDVNESQRTFSVVDEGIRFGLAAVKGVGDGAIEAIIEAREELGGFKGLADFCEFVDLKRVNRRVVEALIKCGAFDALGYRRAALMSVADQMLEYGSRQQRDRASGQTSLFGGGGEDSGPGEDLTPQVPDLPEWPERERLRQEKEALGFYITGHPLKAYEKELKRYQIAPVNTLADRGEGDIQVAGVVASLKEIKTKKGDLMAFVVIEDLTGSVEVTVFPSAYSQGSLLLRGDEPVLIKGTLERQGEEETPKILAEEIKALAEVRSMRASEVHLLVDSHEMTGERMQRMRDWLKTQNGTCEVVLTVRVPERFESVLRLQDARVPATDEVLTEFERIFGRSVASFQ